MTILGALFPTIGDAVAAAGWLLLIVAYLVVRFDEVQDVIDRILDEVFGSGR